MYSVGASCALLDNIAKEETMHVLIWSRIEQSCIGQESWALIHMVINILNIQI